MPLTRHSESSSLLCYRNPTRLSLQLRKAQHTSTHAAVKLTMKAANTFCQSFDRLVLLLIDSHCQLHIILHVYASSHLLAHHAAPSPIDGQPVEFKITTTPSCHCPPSHTNSVHDGPTDKSKCQVLNTHDRLHRTYTKVLQMLNLQTLHTHHPLLSQRMILFQQTTRCSSLDVNGGHPPNIVLSSCSFTSGGGSSSFLQPEQQQDILVYCASCSTVLLAACTAPFAPLAVWSTPRLV